MSLTKFDAWQKFAGGCFAADGKYSYQAETSIGKYAIQPISSDYDVEKHLGYRVLFLNVLGLVRGGLNQPISKRLVTLTEARCVARDHYAKHADRLAVS